MGSFVSIHRRMKSQAQHEINYRKLKKIAFSFERKIHFSVVSAALL